MNNRFIGNISVKNPVASVVVFAGIHGNEKAGVVAAKEVLKYLIDNNVEILGNVYVILGNRNALKKNIRYEFIDLNRIWKKDIIDAIKNKKVKRYADIQELEDIYLLLKEILSKNEGPYYFLDLHTTSAPSQPFITISDSLNNRAFSSKFSVPIVLGIEEYLDGPLLTYLNEFGHISLGFEAGQHEAMESVENCKKFILEALIFTNVLEKGNVKKMDKHFDLRLKSETKPIFYEIVYRHHLEPKDKFFMHNGYQNFDRIEKNQKLAIANEKSIQSPYKGLIFMPLYQNLGEDGFFILKKTSMFWLKFSKQLRKFQLHRILVMVPGIKKDKYNKYTLIVNPKIARFLTKEIFHLFGYRKQIFKDNQLHFIRRDRKITPFH